MTYVPLFYTSTVLMGPTDKPPTGQMLSDMMKAVKIRAAWSPPTVIEQLLEIPGGFEQAAELDFIMYTGGPLAPAAGDKLSQVTDLCQLYGSTESGTQVTLIPDRKTWQYFEWHPHLINEMEPLGDGTFEMVIHKNPDLLWLRQIYHTFPELNTYRTNDLFVQHPENPKLWKFHGRRDDVIVLSNGEKFNPVIMESIISGDSLLQGALIAGMARSQAALIVEPRPNHGLSNEEVVRRIWPTVQKGNLEGPAHGRIFPSKIIVASPDKPFIRAGKGTVIRRHNIMQFEEEIEKVYDGSGEPRRDVSKLKLPLDVNDCKAFLKGYSVDFLVTGDAITDQTDLFNAGLDSLQTSELTAHIKAWLNTNPKAAAKVKVSTKTIYENPTIESLASHLTRTLNLDGEATMDTTATEATTAARMLAVLEKFTLGLSPKLNVILTGSTGSLGTHVLKALLDDPKICNIYCLNRAADARKRQQKALGTYGVGDALSSKAHFFQAHFGDPYFGLPKADFAMLVNKVDIILHNAWKVDFNHKLESFEDVHIRGVRNFVDFCNCSRRNPHLAFVSSVSAVQNWNACYKDVPVPECVVDNFSVALQMGYGQSKHVSERLLGIAQKAGVNASVLRVGQIGGPLSMDAGEWNRTEWFPTLLMTSKTLGCIPATLGAIDWIPVDTLARILVDIVHDLARSGQPQTFNLVNPHRAEWSVLLSVVQERWGLKAVTFEEWVQKLSAMEASGNMDFDSLPALKMLDFFAGMANDLKDTSNRTLDFVTENGQRASKAMADISPIDARALNIWLDQWAF